VVRTLRGLGLTLAEIQVLAGTYTRRGDAAIGPRLAKAVSAARSRTGERIDALRDVMSRIDEFEPRYAITFQR
jgi:hypothetical protein